uniref:Small ribosomal subunit protein uS15c n=1 Tax=Reboulia hemisphaerica TaxID=37395 RepID=A0A4P8J9A9_9MARC|nr:ribosomal protein S15 [Reboulia hemisphaerica]QCP68472.1 ribosomal protein S15 [Reboulia hemisphaerica]
MSKNLFINLSSISEKRKGSVEFQIFHLTNRVVKLNYHFQKHGKDYSSQRGLWKILGKRKRLLAYLFKTNFVSYENLINQLGIRGLKKN